MGDSAGEARRTSRRRVRRGDVLRRPGRCGRPSRVGRARLRAKRHRLRPEHADEPDPGDGRRDRRPAGRQRDGIAALRAAVQAGHLRQRRRTRSRSRSATTPRSPASARRRPTSRSTATSTSTTGASTPDNCIALVNFWRSLSNLTINVMGLAGCRSSGDFWAVSQAAPMRRVNITGGNLTLMDYCTAGPQYASGGFIADSQTGFVINGSQQQFLVRDSSIGGWSNGVWNQVFSGVVGAPPQSFSTTPFDPPPYTTLADDPGHARAAVPLRRRRRARYDVFVPALRHDSSGTTWSERPGRRLVDPDRRVLRRQAERRRADDQQGARAGPEPDLHARRLPPRQDDQGQAARHGRARARLPDARSPTTATRR